MKTLLVCAWMAGTVAVVWEPADFGMIINVAAVGVMALIAWLVKKGVASIEESIRTLSTRLTRANGRLRIVELNVERMMAKQGMRPRHYNEDDDPEAADEL